MKYYLDCEFDGFGGDLISMALVRNDGESIYLVYKEEATDPWVQANVIPHLWNIPSPLPGMAYKVDQLNGAHQLREFFADDRKPHIVSDWPDDIAYFCKSIITAPGFMINIAGFTTEVARVDAYPTRLSGAVQHNAWWDAKALWYLLEK